MGDKFNTTIGIRVNSDDLRDFKNHCRFKLKRPYADVIREMMLSLVDNRLTIEPNQATKELYK